MYVLTLRIPGEPARKVRLERPALTLGRSSSNDIPLGDKTLSRVHARLETSLEGLLLTDLDSRNGTMLNGVRIVRPSPVHAGDQILLGETAVDVGIESVAHFVLDASAPEPSIENTLFRSSRDLVRSHRQAPPAAMGAEELSRLAASLRILNEVSVELLSDIPREKLFDLVLEKIFTYLQPDRGLLVRLDEDSGLHAEAMRFADGIDPSDIRLSRTLVQSVVNQRNGVLMLDTDSDTSLGVAESIRLHGVTSCLAAPLFVDEKVYGLVYVEARLGHRSFTEEDLRLLTSLANAVAMKLRNLELMEEVAEKRAMEKEISLAWDVQRKLLPERPPDLPHTELFGRTVPSRHVSGDYYDFFVRSDGTVDVVVADVCGKGLAASLLAASVQAAHQAWAGEGFPPDRLCERLNEAVCRRATSGKFVTFFSALYDPETGELLFTNAGHNPGLLVRRSGQTELLEAHGLPLGLFPGRRYDGGSLTLKPGDTLVLYTDGVTEALAPDDEEFGLGRLTALAVGGRAKPLEEIEADLTSELLRFADGVPFHDDRTVVLLRRSL